MMDKPINICIYGTVEVGNVRATLGEINGKRFILTGAFDIKTEDVVFDMSELCDIYDSILLPREKVWTIVRGDSLALIYELFFKGFDISVIMSLSSL